MRIYLSENAPKVSRLRNHDGVEREREIKLCGLWVWKYGLMPFMDETIMFFRSIDPGLVRYVDELLKLSVSSESTLRFTGPREIRALNMPDVFKRLLINEICNLQTPDTKSKMRAAEAEKSPLKQLVLLQIRERTRVDWTSVNPEKMTEKISMTEKCAIEKL